jgi:hypothetical protein
VIVEASKYSDVRRAGRQQPRAADTSGRRQGPPPSAPAILVPKHEALVNWDEWLWRELREGGRLHAYLAREKATSARRLRAVARRMNGFRQNAKSEHRLIAAIPAREFHRWKKEDPHFWEDDANLRSFRRDNPDAQIFL